MASPVVNRRTPAARAWSPQRVYLLLSIFPISFFGLFLLWPMARVIVRSFLEPSPGLQNFVHIATMGPYVAVFGATLQIAAAVTLICLVIAYPFAYLASRLHGVAFKIYIGLVLIPLWTSVVVRSFAWMVLFQRNGVINDALMWMNLIDQPIRLLQTPLSVGVGMVHIMLPFMILPIVTSMRSVDPVLIRAGAILGASPLRLFFRVYLPLTLPGVTAGILLVFIGSLGFYITPALLGGARSTMIAVLIRQQASEMLNWPLASALSTTLLVVTLLFFVAFTRLTRRFNEALG